MLKKLFILTSLGLFGLTCFTASPALAIENPTTNYGAAIAPQSIYTAETTLSYSNGVRLHVTYTVNDTYGTITGIKSIKNWTTNSHVSNVSWNYQYGLSNGSMVVTVTYYYNGWHSEARTIYA